MAKTAPQPADKLSRKPSHDEIAKRAYELFEQSERKPGRDMENWLAAEAELTRAQKLETSGSNAAKIITRPAYRDPAGNVRTTHA